MDDLISRKALLEMIQSPKMQVWFNRRVTQSSVHWAIYLANNCPTVEAEPVQHGRWEDAALGYTQVRERCSLCGGIVYAHEFNYCPNCGAKMEEKTK